MDWEGKIGSSHLTCSLSGRALNAGDIFYSALVFSDAQFKRIDFSAEAWDQTNHDDYLSWWRQKIPEQHKERKIFKLNAATLAQIFSNLKDTKLRSQQCLAYVVALALVRARKLNFIDIETVGTEQFLLVQNRSAQVVHRIRDPRLSPEEEEHVLHNLLLLTEHAEDASEELSEKTDS
jgi:hypothetical protein